MKSSDYQYDRGAGCKLTVSQEDLDTGGRITAKAQSDRAHDIFDDAMCKNGEDRALYRFAWKRANGGTLTIKQGVANKKKLQAN
jgi:hypothetical protein